MVIINTASLPLAQCFFSPLADIAAGCRSTRSCPGLSDEDWLVVGVLRALKDCRSGRDFLQAAAAELSRPVASSSFFDSLSSPRRLSFCREANAALCTQMGHVLPDHLACFEALNNFAVYAGDGHHHAAAMHDVRDADGTKYGTPHLYMLDMRTHAAHHLDLCDQKERKKEHDMRTLKRQSAEALRLGAPAGRKVLIVWDRAGIDFDQWRQWKERSGIYFISRPKENMNLARQGNCEYDSADPVNTGVLCDEPVAPATHGRMIRRITFLNPAGGEHWQVLTNEMNLPPGLVVKLYLMRWDIEKMFDEFKNKIMERKSWASSAAGKCMQAVFLCLVHNLMILHEHMLLTRHGIVNKAEDRRRAKRLRDETAAVHKDGRILSPLKEALQRCTQRSVKFIRWLRSFLFRTVPWEAMVADLRQRYLTL